MTQEEMKSVSYTSNALKVSLMPIDSGLRDVIVQAAGGENTYSARQTNDLHNYHFILLKRFLGDFIFNTIILLLCMDSFK